MHNLTIIVVVGFVFFVLTLKRGFYRVQFSLVSKHHSLFMYVSVCVSYVYVYMCICMYVTALTKV